MIVITTPTGRIGRQVLDRVLASGEPVRVIARDPSRLSPRVRERVEVVAGSHNRLDVLAEALDGADSVFWLVPPDPRADSVEGHVLGFTRPFCEAIESREVQRVVGVSTLGRGIARNAGQISASLTMDELIESTGVNYRALQMPGFMENTLQQVGALRNQGAFFLTLSPDRKNPTCATRDIAAVAAELLLDHSWSGQDGVPILGPEDLSPNDMTRIMSEVLGRPIRFQQVSGEAYKATLVRNGVSEVWAQGLVDMAAAVDEGLYRAQPRTPRSTTPTGFRQWCEEVLRPAVAG
ncbi:NAD(P)H-binding protein [Actinoallomurus rhizosphaericola]|uniref:NAD(P)H-binding protein n=1 Tax=Actinoallomurus rhizosphaericola TaxID=2952536 RepID=UPI0020906989|nr:NAD(P)H-binding protein [Actinoallomurus rhizosphaericola]MCO5993399.1 NAD(P)H-binding protein [Actinoallomurus rhizosphaericola]